MSVAAGWYTDPGQTGHLRWWDGQQWTEHIRAPAPAPTAPAAAFALPDAAVSPVGGLGVTSARVAVGSLDPCLPSSTTAILPVHSGGRRAPAVRGWQRPAAVAALVGILAVGGFLGFRTLTSSASPTVTPTAPAVAAPIAAPVDARKAATILDTFKPHDNTPAPGVTSTLVPRGDTLSSATLGGWCGTASHTDATRVARRQWVFVRDGKDLGATAEVAAYSTSAQAKAAFDEFVALTKACSVKVVHIPKGTVTYHRVSVIDERPASDIPSQTAILQEDGVVAATKQKVRIWVTGTVQQRGQFVAIVWSGQRQKYSNIDMAVLRGLAQDETHVLGTTPLS